MITQKDRNIRFWSMSLSLSLLWPLSLLLLIIITALTPTGTVDGGLLSAIGSQQPTR